MFPIQMTFSTEVPSRRTEDLVSPQSARFKWQGRTPSFTLVSPRLPWSSRRRQTAPPHGESVECREVTNAASQHLAADGARMQQPITKNGLQK